jgi:hypothetical protein
MTPKAELLRVFYVVASWTSVWFPNLEFATRSEGYVQENDWLVGVIDRLQVPDTISRIDFFSHILTTYL